MPGVWTWIPVTASEAVAVLVSVAALYAAIFLVDRGEA